MSQNWNNTPTYPVPTTALANVDSVGRLIEGVKAARTLQAGSASPSAVADTAFSSTDVGTLHHDTTTAAQPALKQYRQITAGPTYGWQTLQLVRKLRPADVVAVVALTSTSVDVAYGAAVSLATIFDNSVQTSGQVGFRVWSVLLRVRVRFTSSTHPTGDKLWVKLKNADGTQERQLSCPTAVNTWMEYEVQLHLNSSEEYKLAVDTAAGGNTVEYQIDAIEAEEQV